jgi:EmrB/QacA subfamily drug resistance transporter
MRLPAPGLAHKAYSPNLVLAIVCLGIFLAALDQTVIYGALPGIMNDINLPVTQLDQAAWIVIGYLLGYTFAMPLLGRISDVYGHGKIYSVSLLIFIAGSILVALSTSLQWIVAARIIQAIGGGALVPVAMAIAGDLFTDRRRAIALGIIGAAVEAGGAIGPFYGAALSQYWSWQWIFWINVPISLGVIAVVFLFVPRNPRVQSRIDYAGGFLIALILTLFSLGISQQSGQSHFVVYLLVFLLAAIALSIFFVWRSRRMAAPLIRLAMFKNPTFSAANITNFFIGGALIIAMVNVPLMSDTIMGKTPLEGGLRLLRLTVMLSIGAIIGGVLCRRWGYRLPTATGLLVSSLGFFLMSRWPLDIADPLLTLHLAVCGCGLGLVIAPLSTAVVDSAGAEQRGLASSILIMMRMVGMIIGLAAITSWGMGRFHLMTASLSLSDILNNPQEIVPPLLNLFHDFFLAAMVICLIALIPTWWIKEKRPSRNR